MERSRADATCILCFLPISSILITSICRFELYLKFLKGILNIIRSRWRKRRPRWSWMGRQSHLLTSKRTYSTSSRDGNLRLSRVIEWMHADRAPVSVIVRNKVTYINHALRFTIVATKSHFLLYTNNENYQTSPCFWMICLVIFIVFWQKNWFDLCCDKLYTTIFVRYL